jgi:hypothetical protein
MTVDLISEIAEHTGTTPDRTRKGLGVMRAMVDKNLPADVNARLSQYLPDIEPAVPAKKGGGLMGFAGKMMGGRAAQMAEALQLFNAAGFSMSQAQDFVPKVLEVMEKRVPPDLVEELKKHVPK